MELTKFAETLDCSKVNRPLLQCVLETARGAFMPGEINPVMGTKALQELNRYTRILRELGLPSEDVIRARDYIVSVNEEAFTSN